MMMVAPLQCETVRLTNPIGWWGGWLSMSALRPFWPRTSPSLRATPVASACGGSGMITQLFKQHGHRVYRRALRILGNSTEAEEATQEVFIRAMQHVEEIQDDREVLAWLYRVTTNWCLTHIRDRKRRRELHAEHFAGASVEEPSVGARGDDVILLRRLFASVDERQAEAAILVLLDGMSHAEAAEVLGVSRRTVGNLIERFQSVMDAALDERGQS
jgi:RNA polymerase sigma-70 factor (ECF subfamily)